jgi:membrane protein
MSVDAPSCLRIAWLVLKTAGEKFFHDNGLLLSSALAFNLLLYFIPLSLLMVSLLAYTVLDSERAIHEIESVLRAFLPHSQEGLADNLRTVVENRGLLGFVGAVSFLIFSSFLFGSVRTVLNHIFQVRQARSLVRGIGVDILMVVFTATLILLVVGVAWFVTLASAFAGQYPIFHGLAQPSLEAFSKIFGATATACLLYVLYRFPPVATLSPRALAVGAITGTVLFQLARWMFGWYVAVAEKNVDVYGALAGLMFLFVWLYYASLVFIIGGEVGWAYEQQRIKRDASLHGA